MGNRVYIYDATLRDGIQREGISLSIEDKLRIATRLDALGVSYIEGGFPGSNPKDAEFFNRAKDLNLKNAKIVAFGSTCRKGMPAFKDEGLNTIIKSGVKVAALVGKASAEQVEHVLNTTRDESIRMIRDSIRYLREAGIEVFFDAEHFFDGYVYDKEYSLRVLRVAAEAGASCLVLCDTNGGTLPQDIHRIVTIVKQEFSDVQLGIHAHDDSGCAVANTLLAVACGVEQVQGCMNGYGERVGNANLATIIPALELKMGYDVVGKEALSQLTSIAQFVAETANVSLDAHAPYVGSSAFTHKGGFHVSAVMRDHDSYNHVDPQLVGNFARIVVSELAGRAALEAKSLELGIDLSRDPKTVERVLSRVKELEANGYSFEVANASLALLIADECGGRNEYFRLETFRVITERMPDGTSNSEATIKIHVGDNRYVATGEGNGPVNALDAALRLAIAESYPEVEAIELTDYKVRVLDESSGTDACTRVLIESTDGRQSWGTVGVSENVIEASWDALVESIAYGLMRQGCQ